MHLGDTGHAALKFRWEFHYLILLFSFHCSESHVLFQWKNHRGYSLKKRIFLMIITRIPSDGIWLRVISYTKIFQAKLHIKQLISVISTFLLFTHSNNVVNYYFLFVFDISFPTFLFWMTQIILVEARNGFSCYNFRMRLALLVAVYSVETTRFSLSSKEK